MKKLYQMWINHIMDDTWSAGQIYNLVDLFDRSWFKSTFGYFPFFLGFIKNSISINIKTSERNPAGVSLEPEQKKTSKVELLLSV